MNKYYEYHVERKFFRTKILSEYGRPLVFPEWSKFRIKIVDKGHFILESDNYTTMPLTNLQYNKETKLAWINSSECVNLETGEHLEYKWNETGKFWIDPKNNHIMRKLYYKILDFGFEFVDFAGEDNEFVILKNPKTGKYVFHTNGGGKSITESRIVSQEFDTPPTDAKIFKGTDGQYLTTYQLIQEGSNVHLCRWDHIKTFKGSEAYCINKNLAFKNKKHSYNDVGCVYDDKKNQTKVIDFFRKDKRKQIVTVKDHLESIIDVDGISLFVTKDKNGKCGVVNEQNVEIVPHKYDEIKAKHEFFLLKKDDKYGAASFDGHIVEPEYEEIILFGEKYVAKKEKEGDDKWGIVDKDGKIVEDFKFTKVNGKYIDGYWSLYFKGHKEKNELYGLRLDDEAAGKSYYLSEEDGKLYDHSELSIYIPNYDYSYSSSNSESESHEPILKSHTPNPLALIFGATLGPEYFAAIDILEDER